VEEIEAAFLDAYAHRRPSARPVVEMTLPTSLDTTLAPPGVHVAQLFVQYAPYDLDPAVGSWKDEGFKRAFARRVYGIIDEKAPGFSDSILGACARVRVCAWMRVCVGLVGLVSCGLVPIHSLIG
jgi:phytoene dehydrogenase-like protein